MAGPPFPPPLGTGAPPHPAPVLGGGLFRDPRARRPPMVQCAKGLVVQAQHSFADAPPLDVLVYPGDQGTRPQLHDETVLVRCDESSNTARRRRCKPQRIVLSRDNN